MFPYFLFLLLLKIIFPICFRLGFIFMCRRPRRDASVELINYLGAHKQLVCPIFAELLNYPLECWNNWITESVVLIKSTAKYYNAILNSTGYAGGRVTDGFSWPTVVGGGGHGCPCADLLGNCNTGYPAGAELYIEVSGARMGGFSHLTMQVLNLFRSCSWWQFNGC